MHVKTHEVMETEKKNSLVSNSCLAMKWGESKKCPENGKLQT